MIDAITKITNLDKVSTVFNYPENKGNNIINTGLKVSKTLSYTKDAYKAYFSSIFNKADDTLYCCILTGLYYTFYIYRGIIFRRDGEIIALPVESRLNEKLTILHSKTLPLNIQTLDRATKILDIVKFEHVAFSDLGSNDNKLNEYLIRKFTLSPNMLTSEYIDSILEKLFVLTQEELNDNRN